MTKGKQLYIEGKLQTSSWDDKETGKKRYRTEVIGNNFKFLSSANEQSSNAPSQGMPADLAPPQNLNSGVEDDVPF